MGGSIRLQYIDGAGSWPSHEPGRARAERLLRPLVTQSFAALREKGAIDQPPELFSDVSRNLATEIGRSAVEGLTLLGLFDYVECLVGHNPPLNETTLLERFRIGEEHAERITAFLSLSVEAIS